MCIDTDGDKPSRVPELQDYRQLINTFVSQWIWLAYVEDGRQAAPCRKRPHHNIMHDLRN